MQYFDVFSMYNQPVNNAALSIDKIFSVYKSKVCVLFLDSTNFTRLHDKMLFSFTRLLHIASPQQTRSQHSPAERVFRISFVYLCSWIKFLHKNIRINCFVRTLVNMKTIVNINVIDEKHRTRTNSVCLLIVFRFWAE